MQDELLSHCCEAKRKAVHDEDGTGYYVCEKCGKEFMTNDDMYHLSESERLRFEYGNNS
jgi:hypothetical protein